MSAQAPPRGGRALIDGYADAYRGLRPEVWLLALVMFVNRAGTMVVPFLSLYLTRELGMGAGTVGAVLAAYGAGAVAGSFAGGWALRRADAFRVQAGSLAGTALGFLVLSALREPAAVVVWVAVLGALTESFRPANAAALSACAPPEVRRRAFALNRLAVNLGMTAGPALGGLLAGVGYAWLFAVDGLTCVVAAVGVVLVFDPRRRGRTGEEAPGAGDPSGEASGTPAEDGDGGRWWRDAGYLAFLGCLGLTLLIFMQVSSAYPLYLLDHHGIDEASFGLLLGGSSVILVVFEVWITHRTEAVDARRILAAGALLVGVGFGLTPLAGGPLALAPLVVAWTVGEILIMPTSMAAAASLAAPHGAGHMSAYFATFSVAFILAPVVGLGLYGAAPAFVWWLSLALAPVIAAGFLANPRLRPSSHGPGG
ncbi:MFS transporter [Streptomyces sp. NBC_00239]|uniref:MFS transporter n=1 Tax=Streptomyces sp. NBC_00239 TaxID=2903640 RepID=UPI002E2DFEE7|nr:MFS transporter [Streptomyces sp. NBC_00239]